MPLTPIAIKTYKALINQTGTNAPTVKILQNTIGNITWTRDSEGFYLGTLTAAFPQNKTTVSIATTVNSESHINGFWNDPNSIGINTADAGTTGDVEILQDCPIEINVYS